MHEITWAQALAWRMRQQLLEPVAEIAVERVVDRLGAVPAQPELNAELAIRMRRAHSERGEVIRALADGRLIKTFAFRGATHLLTPEHGGAYLALRKSSKMWELPSWQSYYGLKPADWTGFRDAVRESLDDGPLTLDEIGVKVTASARYRHLISVFDGDAVTLFKPLAWHGDICFGPARDGHWTFDRLDRNPRWLGLPALNEAGMRAVESYFRAYGPATPDHLLYWLGNGLGVARKRILGWLEALGERLVPVDVDGQVRHILREDVDELVASSETSVVRYLPGYDQWVLGPGTADEHVVPPSRRTLVSRQANLVIYRGLVSATWAIRGDGITVNWFGDAGPAPKAALEEEAGRLASIVDRPLEFALATD